MKEIIPPRPPRKTLPESPEDWMRLRAESEATTLPEAPPKPPEAVYQGVKRITVEVPPWLHLKIKRYCLDNGKNISDEVREMLFERFK